MAAPTFFPTIAHDHVRASLPAGRILLSAASSQAASTSRDLARGRITVPDVPPQIDEIAVDPGGWTAAIRGGYRFTWGEYIEFNFALGDRLTWAAFPDLPCEPELASDNAAIRCRQKQTLEWAEMFWGGPATNSETGDVDDTEDDALVDERAIYPWAWVPTVQGREPGDYRRHARDLRPLLESQQRMYNVLADRNRSPLAPVDGDPTLWERADQIGQWAEKCVLQRRVGIGSLCKRTNTREIVEVVAAVRDELPGERFHLWGVSRAGLRALQRANLIGCIVSFDTSAFNGRWGSSIAALDAERATLGISQRDYTNAVALPRYAQRTVGQLAQESLPI